MKKYNAQYIASLELEIEALTNRAEAAEAKVARVMKLPEMWRNLDTIFAAYHFCADELDEALQEP